MVILTKACNEILDKAGLKELTVSRTSRGVLAIVGRVCGKDIMSFSELPISKKLSKVERDILIHDYFMPTLTKHKVNLTKLIKLSPKTSMTPIKEFEQAMFDTYKVKINFGADYSSKTTPKTMKLYGRFYRPEDEDRIIILSYYQEAGTFKVEFEGEVEKSVVKVTDSLTDIVGDIELLGDILVDYNKLWEVQQKAEKDLVKVTKKLAVVCTL